MCLYVCLCMCLCMHMCMCLYACLYVFMYVLMYVCAVCVCICMCRRSIIHCAIMLTSVGSGYETRQRLPYRELLQYDLVAETRDTVLPISGFIFMMISKFKPCLSMLLVMKLLLKRHMLKSTLCTTKTLVIQLNQA